LAVFYYNDASVSIAVGVLLQEGVFISHHRIFESTEELMITTSHIELETRGH
jgi:hypothetical protein